VGQPVVHFEIVGKDAEKLQAYYGELVGWKIHCKALETITDFFKWLQV